MPLALWRTFQPKDPGGTGNFACNETIPPVIKHLTSHISQFCSIEPEKLSQIEPFFEYKKYKKKELLLKEGQKCYEKSFIVKGCVHLFYLRQNGVEQTVDNVYFVSITIPMMP